MKKKLLLIFFTITLLLFSTFTTFANNLQPTGSISSSILVDGKPIDRSDYEFYINPDDIEMYPLRLIAESLGAEVTWEASKNSVLIKRWDREILLNPASNKVVINGVEKKISYNVEIKDSRIYVPAEFIIETIGARIVLNETTQAINLIKPADTLETIDLSDVDLKIKNTLVSYLTSLELNRNFSGQILVKNNGNILIDRSYGYSDYENHIKAFNSTTFAIGSVTKQFTAAAIVQLAENNKLSYDDKVSKYFNNVPFADQITIHQLLTHTSGLYNYTNLLPDLLGTDLSEMTFEALMSLIEDKPLDFEPGTNWSYSNTGYLILGEIVEQVSGKTLEHYLQENIFNPAGMINTGIAFRLDEKLLEANGYSGHMEVVLDSYDSVLLNIAYGAGYLASTAQDLYRWNEALLAGEIVSLESLDRMFGKSSDMNLLVPYAYGWIFNTGEYGEEISHGGNTIGFTSDNAIFTEKDAQIIILTNKGYADLLSIKSNIISILNGNVISPLDEITYITVSEEQMNKYAGAYEIKGLLKIDILVHDGKLYLQGENQPAIELAPLSETTFESSLFGIAIEFNSIDSPTEFTLNQAGQQFKAVRLE